MEGLIFSQNSQVSINKVLEVFGYYGAQSVHKDMKQLKK